MNDLYDKLLEGVPQAAKLISLKEFQEFVNPSVCHNVLKLNQHEIQIEKDQDNINEYIVRVNDLKKYGKKVKVNFGCELEICFVLNCHDGNDNVKILEDLSKIRSLFNKKSYTKADKSWFNLLMYHLKHNLIPYFTPEFLKRFPFVYVLLEPKENDAILIDLKTGEVVREEKKRGYEYLILTQDHSLRCGDSPRYKDYNQKGDLDYTVHCEIVSPILNNYEDLRLMYDNLLARQCIVTNKKAGFHVNVSVADVDGNPIDLQDGAVSEILRDWLPYEKKNYEKLRGKEGTIFAVKIEERVGNNNMIRNFFTKKDGSILTDYMIKTNPAIKYLVQEYITRVKYTSLHRKNDSLFEFRVFPSKTDIDTLMEYTQDSIDLFRTAVQRYIDNSSDIIFDLQSTYMKIKDNVSPTLSNQEYIIEDYTYDLGDQFSHLLEFKGINGKPFYVKKESSFFGLFDETKTYYKFPQKDCSMVVGSGCVHEDPETDDESEICPEYQVYKIKMFGRSKLSISYDKTLTY